LKTSLLLCSYVPLLHGDTCWEADGLTNIVSGDTLMRQLAATLNADAAIFLSDVDGLLERPPTADGK
jgi:isopentenyl phosphate kinase